MKVEPLIKYVKFPEREISVFKNTNIVQSNSTSLWLCRNQQLLRSVLTELSHYKDNTNIISCMNGPLLERTIGIPPHTSPNTFTELIDSLKDRFLGTIEFSKTLDLLLIENISAFYWDMKVVDKYNFSKLGFKSFEQSQNCYNMFIKLLQQIKQKYHCSIVVTAFDIEFDLGLNPAREIPTIELDCQKFSLLPLVLLESFDTIMHIDTLERIEIFQKNTNKWSNLEY